jgi:hypothetical protein
MNFNQVLRAGRASFSYMAIGIATAITLGLLLGRLLEVSPRTIKQAGPRVLLQGLILRLVVATASLVVICKVWIHL